MKKAIAIALASALALPALADISVDGSARFRVGVKEVRGDSTTKWLEADNWWAETKTKDHVRDHRMRLNFTGELANAGVWVRFESTNTDGDDVNSRHHHLWVDLTDKVRLTMGDFEPTSGSGLLHSYLTTNDNNAVDITYTDDMFSVFVRNEAVKEDNTDTADYTVFGGSANIGPATVAFAKRPGFDTDNTLGNAGFTNMYLKVAAEAVTVDLELLDSDADDASAKFVRVVAPVGDWTIKAAKAKYDTHFTWSDDLPLLGEAIFDADPSGYSLTTDKSSQDYLGVAVAGNLGPFAVQVGGGTLKEEQTQTSGSVVKSGASSRFFDVQAKYTFEPGSSLTLNAGEVRGLSAFGASYNISF